MKTMETTEEVSSRGVEKRAERHKCQRSAPFAREKPRVDGKKDLQIYGAGRKSRKRPALVVGQKPYGKCQINIDVQRTMRLNTMNIGHTSALVALACLAALVPCARAQQSTPLVVTNAHYQME